MRQTASGSRLLLPVKDKARLWLAILGLTAIGLLAAGCGRPQPASRPFTIVTSFYPVYVTTVNVTGGIDGVDVVNMASPQTGCLHDYQLTPADLRKIERADVVVINGAGMEGFLDKLLSERPGLGLIDASRGIDLITDDKGEVNPHVWLSISLAIRQVENIAAQLAGADPAHAEQYRRNADTYIARLASLREEMHAAVDRLPERRIVTFHEAFPYFAREFNLLVAAVVEREPGSQPSAGQLAEIIDLVNREHIRAIFAEPQYPPQAAEVIAGATGARVYMLDPVVTDDPAVADAERYITAMRSNQRVLVEALQ
ncbi:MAG: metal ABC transporter substrate-binding protein [Negativicutes bacterium]|nr:metal ABC transporter substrate-binding protein [Negativicutes bacterium]